MSKKLFWILSLTYSLISAKIELETSGIFYPHWESIAGEYIGTALGMWIHCGVVPYCITHLGKGKDKPSRNIFALIIATFVFAVSAYHNLVVKPQYKQAYDKSVEHSQIIKNSDSDDLDKWIKYEIEVLEKDNALIALLNKMDPSYRVEIHKAFDEDCKQYPVVCKNLLERWKKGNHSLTLSDLDFAENMWKATEKVFSKYILFASSDDIYDMLQVEYKHMKKNECKGYRLPEEDRQETIQTKIKLIENSLKNPQKTKPMNEEEVKMSVKKILSYYIKKGYNVNNFIRFMQGDKTFSEKEYCTVSQEYFEAILSLPKDECARVMKSMTQMDMDNK